MSSGLKPAVLAMSQQIDWHLALSSSQTTRTITAGRLQQRLAERRNLRLEDGRTPHTALNLGIFLGMVLVLGIAFLAFENAYATRINPHVSIDGIAMGGVSLVDARTYLDDKLASLDKDPIGVSVAQQASTVTAAQFHVRYATAVSLKQAKRWGHETNLLTRFWNQLQGIVLGRDFSVSASYDQRAVQQYLVALNRKVAVKPVSARAGIAGGRVGIVRQASSGIAIDLQGAAHALGGALGPQHAGSVTLPVQTLMPEIGNDQAQLVVDQAQQLVSKPIYFSSVSRVRAWYITPSQLLNLLTFKTVSQPGKASTIVLGIDMTRLRAALAPIAAAVDHPPVPATYMVAVGQGGQPDSAVPQPDGPGLAIDIEKTAQAILNAGTTHSVIIPLVHPHAAFDLSAARAMNFDSELTRATLLLNGISLDRLKEAEKAAALVNNTRLAPGESLSLKALFYPDKKTKAASAAQKGLATTNGGASLVATALYQAAYSAGLTIKARTAASAAVSAQTVPGSDAQVGRGKKAPDLIITNNSTKPLLINVVPYKDQLVTYVFTQSTLQRSVSVSSPTVVVNQDGTIVVQNTRSISGDIQKQDASTTTYMPLDTYR